MPVYSRTYLEHVNQGCITHQTLTERPETTLVGLMVNGSRRNLRIWETLKIALEESSYTYEDGNFYRVQMVLQNNFNLSFVGITERTSKHPLPPLSTLHLPAELYARFLHKGEQSEVEHSLNYIYHTGLWKSPYERSHSFEIELFPDPLPLHDCLRKEWEIQIPVRMKEKRMRKRL
jgi:predicted transcriptional regulator YdeE